MTSQQILSIFAVGVATMLHLSGGNRFTPRPDIGYPAGFIPDCPGVTKNATIGPGTISQLQVVHQRTTEKGLVVRQPMPINIAAKSVAKNKYIDLKNKKTVVYACGFFDSSVFPHSQALGKTYYKRGYNVFITETFTFLTNIYPISARLTRFIGKKLGEFLVKLTAQGMAPEKLELVGVSLGAHIVSYAAKHYFAVIGKKPSRITGLDPAGPCFRSLPPDMKLNPSDAEKVDVIHTNIDGFGIAEPLGHIDFYVNGGEFQPGDIPYIPCLVVCSHVRSFLYWWVAVDNPKKFIGVKCDSVQDARFANCYNNSQTNYIGIEAKFDRPGLYYVGTSNEFPYYRGKDGLKSENEIYTSLIRNMNSDDNFQA